ncbi:hypothetical protein [Roseibium sp.]|uniref:hypothetical protein n=1 Tax=Roseibium sp. TaxID=1936156 RepID=UPI003A980CCC
MPLGTTSQTPIRPMSHGGLIAPGFLNVTACYLALCLVLPSPLGFYFACRNAGAPGRRLSWHYHYIRVTCAGAWLGTLASLSALFVGANMIGSALPAGLLLLGLTVVWSFYRSLYGLYCALHHRPLRNHKTWLV